MAVAIVSGASKGLGRDLAAELARRGWSLVIDGRNAGVLAETERALSSYLGEGSQLVAVVGDVSQPEHRAALIAAAAGLGGLDLLVNNASVLGTSPLVPLGEYSLVTLREVFEVNLFACLALFQESQSLLGGSPDPRLINVSSDAAVEAYSGWGGYGASKAALDQLSAVLAVEEPGIRVWAFDPGDMRTDMHQAAFPGEDLSDRPLPQSVVPHLIALIESDLPSGRYRAAEVITSKQDSR